MATINGTFSPSGLALCDCPAIDGVDYCAVPVWTGEHAGMIALTITGQSNEACNDTFYGCYDFATNQWQVEIPNSCCYGKDCRYCPPGLTPKYITITFAGTIGCEDCYYGQMQTGSVDGEYTIEQNPSNPCQWLTPEYPYGKGIPGDYGLYKRWQYSNCTGTVDEYPCIKLRMRVYRDRTEITISADSVTAEGHISSGFGLFKTTDLDCVIGFEGDNLYHICPEVHEYYGGSVIIS